MSGPSVLAEFFSAFFSGAYGLLTEPIISAELLVVGCLAVIVSGFFAIDECRTDDVFSCVALTVLVSGVVFMLVLMAWWLAQYGT